MADFTPNYNLKKPLQEEFYDVDDFNGNADIIDTELKSLHDDIADLQGGTAAEKADGARKDLDFKRKLRLGGLI